MRAIIVALSLSMGTALAAGPTDNLYPEQRPRVLNVGVPGARSASELDLNGRLGLLRSVLGVALARDVTESPADLRINVAIGNDYQILDWLHQGLIEAAIVPDLTLALLDRDALAVHEIEPETEEAKKLLPLGEVAPQAWRRDARDMAWIDKSLGPLGEYDAFLAEIVSAASGGPGTPGRRLVLASHLSSTGFLWPVARAARRFEEERLVSEKFRITRAWGHFFSSTRFVFDCETAEECFESAVVRGPDTGETAVSTDGRTFVLFPGERTLRERPSSGLGEAYREHLIIAASAAKRLVSGQAGREPGALRRRVVKPPAASVTEIFAQPAVSTLFEPEPLLGTRPFAFSVDETVDLLQGQIIVPRDDGLALVLPGGGVKTAYQTRILDEMYGRGLLRNGPAPEDKKGTADGRPPLLVKTVIGTSGGALLGYFIAQLQDRPIPLFDILWKKGDGQLLTSTDVFGWTDLLRYVSVVVSYAILCVLLFFAFGRPPNSGGSPGHRPRLNLTVMPLFVITPVLIRWASTNREHVPEIEGVFYMLMTILVIVADQAIVRVRDAVTPTPQVGAQRQRCSRIFAMGGVGFLLSAWLLFREGQAVSFWVAFATMVGLLIGVSVAVHASGNRLAFALQWGAEVGLALAVVLLLCSFGLMFRMPHIVAGIALMLLAAIQFQHGKTRFTAGRGRILVTFAATFFIAELCWTSELRFGARAFSLEFLRRQSLPITAAALHVSLGLLLIVAASALWAGRGKNYAWSGTKEVASSLLLTLAYALLTLLILMTLTRFAPEFVTPLELTRRYWVVLAAVSVLVGILVVAATRRRWFGSTPLTTAIPFLVSAHPNGRIVQCRYLRLLVLAGFGVAWWNTVSAPALYGNRTAQVYRDDAIRRFNDARDEAMKGGGPSGFRFLPTARFVTPANLLRREGTRYFLFLPPGELDCADLPTQDSSGAKWTVYTAPRASDVEGSDERGHSAQVCRVLTDAELPGEVAFASGSPFPILAAHEIRGHAKAQLPPEDQEEAYVDGGYSNNVPVDAAHTLGARRVLIVESSSPLPPRQKRGAWGDFLSNHVMGRLIVNAWRLPAYLFERSQVVDRLRRRDMFVVSLAPSRDEPSWPPLFDFRRTTVSRMESTAKMDLAKRIGLVQSWGVPSFAFPTVSAMARRGREASP